MDNVAEAIVRAVSEAMRTLQAGIKEEISDQGHVLTGKLRDSIVYEVEALGDKVRAVMYVESYGIYLEFGVPASRIPYNQGSGRGKSAYIEGLIRFFELRGRVGKEAVRAAFATARVHKREGMPSRGSFAYSKNGRRTGFAKTVLEKHINRIGGLIAEKTGAYLSLTQFPDSIKMERVKISV